MIVSSVHVSSVKLLAVPSAVDIKPGEHKVGHVGGVAFNLDTIWSTLIALVILLGLGLVARRALTRTTKDHVPTKVQLLWETVTKEVGSQVEDNLGEIHPYVFPLATSLFFFILISNWLELLPTDFGEGRLHITPAPTGDVNLTYAMALLVFISTWVYGIKKRGFLGYFGGFVSDSVAANKLVDIPARGFFTALNVLEELIKPVTLALRLFGNIFAGGIMLLLIAALMHWQLGHVPVGGVVGFVLNIVWKLFDAFIGAIQAFIFALLTVLYFAMAGSGHGSGEEHGEAHAPDKATDPTPADSPREKAPQLVA